MDIEPNFGTVTSVRAVSHRFFGFVTKVKKSSSNEMGPNKRSLAAASSGEGVRGGGGEEVFWGCGVQSECKSRTAPSAAAAASAR